MTVTIAPTSRALASHVDGLDRTCAARFFVQGGHPRFLYKFHSASSAASLRGIIVDSKIWFASPEDFNDPFDIRAKVELQGNRLSQLQFVAKRIRQLRVPGDHAQHMTQAAALLDGSYLETIQGDFSKNVALFGVTCFASRGTERFRGSGPRDILMWSHYANCHRGVCFQFHLPRSPLFFAHSRRVNYRDRVVRINWMDKAGRGDRIFDALVTKSIHWAYEREYRISIPDAARTLHAFTPPALSGIIIGCRADQPIRDQVKELLTERVAAGLPTVRLYNAEQADDSYRLMIRRAL